MRNAGTRCSPQTDSSHRRRDNRRSERASVVAGLPRSPRGDCPVAAEVPDAAAPEPTRSDSVASDTPRRLRRRLLDRGRRRGEYGDSSRSFTLSRPIATPKQITLVDPNLAATFASRIGVFPSSFARAGAADDRRRRRLRCRAASAGPARAHAARGGRAGKRPADPLHQPEPLVRAQGRRLGRACSRSRQRADPLGATRSICSPPRSRCSSTRRLA